MGWAPACRLKGHWSCSWSGHTPGVWARSPVRGLQEATDPCFSPSLKINKQNIYIKRDFSLFKNGMFWSRITIYLEPHWKMHSREAHWETSCLRPFTFILGQHSLNTQPIYFVTASDTLLLFLLLLFSITAWSFQCTEKASWGVEWTHLLSDEAEGTKEEIEPEALWLPVSTATRDQGEG